MPVGGLGFYAGALERVCLPVGSFLAGALTSWQPFATTARGGFARDFQVARAMFVKTMPDVRLITSC